MGLKSKSGLWWVCLLWVAIVGQAYSYPTMSCQMMTNHGTQTAHSSHDMNPSFDPSMDHDSMDHSQMHHDMDTSSQVNSSSDDCCGSECQCPASACTAYSFIASLAWASAPSLTDDKVIMMDVALHLGLKNALFRPPISA